MDLGAEVQNFAEYAPLIGVSPPHITIGFKKKLAVTSGCVGVTVLSKILRRVALPQGPTPYPYILFCSERVQPFCILFIGKINGSLSHTSLKHCRAPFNFCR